MVYVAVEGGSTAAPDFVLNRRTVEPRQEGSGVVMSDRGIALHAQITGPDTYVVPGIGLATRL